MPYSTFGARGHAGLGASMVPFSAGLEVPLEFYAVKHRVNSTSSIGIGS